MRERKNSALVKERLERLKNDTNDEGTKGTQGTIWERYGRITGHVKHNFCGTQASRDRLGTIYHFVTPEVLTFNQFLKFFLLLRITLSINCLLTYKILKVCYLG